jgi:hypothetical protein
MAENTHPFDETLQAYIAQVLKIQQEKNQAPLAVEELNKVALDLGLSAEDLNLIEDKFQGFLLRGLGFSRYRNWEKSIHELQQAVNIKPMHIEALFGLADAYRNVWLTTASKSARSKAQIYAERTLQYHYNHEGALHLLSQLQTAKPARKIWQSYGRLALYLTGTVILVLMIYYFWQNPAIFSPQKNRDLSTHTRETQVIKENIEVKIELINNSQSTDLQLDTESSFLKKSADGFIYTLRACLLNQKREINEINAKIRLLDKEDKIVYEEKWEILSQDNPEFRPKDALPLSKIIQSAGLNSSVQKAQLVIEKLRSGALNPPYEDSNKLTINWDSKRPSNINLDLRERSQTIKPEVESFSHTLVFEYKNLGKNPLKNFKILIQWFDVDNRLVHEESADLLNPTEPILKSGQVRRKGFIYTIDLKRADYQQYKVIAQEVE